MIRIPTRIPQAKTREIVPVDYDPSLVGFSREETEARIDEDVGIGARHSIIDVS